MVSQRYPCPNPQGLDDYVMWQGELKGASGSKAANQVTLRWESHAGLFR